MDFQQIIHEFQPSWVSSPLFQDNKDGLQNVQLVMMGNGEENFGPAAICWVANPADF